MEVDDTSRYRRRSVGPVPRRSGSSRAQVAGREDELVRALVGDITPTELRHVDFVVSSRVGVFIPVTGPCGYATRPAHTHPSYSFVLTFDDRTRVELDGRIIGGRSGSLVAFAPGVPHTEIPTDGPPRYAAVCVESTFFEACVCSHAPLRERELRGLEVHASRGVVACLRRLVAEHEGRAPGFEEVLAAREVELVHLMLRDLARDEESPPPSVETTVKLTERLGVGAAVHLAHARFRHRITVAELARAAGMSPSHFAREWKREVGTPPLEYVMGLRIEAARRRLVAGDESLTTIALECGFGSSSYFAYVFGRRLGLTPSEYRKRHCG